MAITPQKNKNTGMRFHEMRSDNIRKSTHALTIEQPCIIGFMLNMAIPITALI